MNTYEIELRRTSYITMNIEAKSKDEAETLAWQELASDGSYGLEDASWDIESIEELFATDESRSYGNDRTQGVDQQAVIQTVWESLNGVLFDLTEGNPADAIETIEDMIASLESAGAN